MTSLMVKPCGERCSSAAAFKITFIINSMALVEEEYYRDKEKILSITWDKHVFRFTFRDALEGWLQELQIHCTPQQLSEKLKACPIMMNISTTENEQIGTVTISLSNCFCDSMLCEDFKLQQLHNDFKFFLGGEETALMDFDLIVQRNELDEDAAEALERALKEATGTHSKASSLSDGKSSELLYSEFTCPDELSEECKQNLALGKRFYRIVNGHLVNAREKRGFCGDSCSTTTKYCKELKESFPPKEPLSVDIFKLFNEKSEKVDCRTLKKRESLDKMCEFLENKFQTPRGNETLKEPTKTESNKSKRCRKKSSKKCKEPKQIDAPLRVNIEEIKQPTFQKYSYSYGYSYPFHRNGCNMPKPSESVPSNMGWRHDKLQLRNKSWYPGQINKAVRILMKHHLRPYPYDTIPLSNANHKMKIDGSSSDDVGDNELKSTLHVTKRNGEIFIQMHPLKEGRALETDCHPYLNCAPLKFIFKKRPEEIKQHKARMIMKSRGFERKCECIDINFCRCKSQSQKLLFQEELKRVSAELALRKEMQYKDVYDSSDSEVNFEFTPPVVAIMTTPKWKPNVTHTGTQYNVKHFTRKFVPKFKSLK